jgi:flagellin-like protein
MKFGKNDEAVSPVIGVILMVAITVILAAVIAAFVFGMGSSLQASHNAAYKVSRDSNNNANIVLNGLDSDIHIKSGAINYVNSTGEQNVTSLTALTIGSIQPFDINQNTTRVIVNVTFSDNSQKVVLDSKI